MGLCPCLLTGQLDTDERTKDDAGAIQNLVVCHGGMTAHGVGAGLPRQSGACGLSIRLRRRSDGRLGPQATSTTPRTDARQPSCNGRCAWVSVTEVILHRAQVGALIGKVVAARMAQHVRPDAAELRLLASDPHDIIDGLAG